MVPPRPIVVRTITDDAIDGSTCNTITRNGDAPSATAASMNTSLRTLRVSA
jgi:hypothetical protein